MLNLRTAFLMGATAVAAALSACNGNAYNAPTTGGPCGAPSGKVTLSYPAPNSTGIPDNISGIIFTSTNGLSNSYNARIVPAGASQYVDFQYIANPPNPLPTPNVQPFPNAIFQSSAVPAGYVLPAGTLIAVYLNDGATDCVPSFQGSFTSQ